MDALDEAGEKWVGAGRPRAPHAPATRAAQFAAFFSSLYTTATEKARAAVSPQELLRTSGLGLDLSPRVEERLISRLRAPTSRAAAGECGACAVCGACALCGEISLGTPGSAAAAVWATLADR